MRRRRQRRLIISPNIHRQEQSGTLSLGCQPPSPRSLPQDSPLWSRFPPTSCDQMLPCPRCGYIHVNNHFLNILNEKSITEQRGWGLDKHPNCSLWGCWLSNPYRKKNELTFLKSSASGAECAFSSPLTLVAWAPVAKPSQQPREIPGLLYHSQWG